MEKHLEDFLVQNWKHTAIGKKYDIVEDEGELVGQPKIERMLRLMKMMSGNTNYTIDELAEKLGMSYRSVYRYIDTFKASGFVIEKLQKNVYKKEIDGKWILETMASDMAGVGRFVIGLADEVKVIDSPALRDYISQFVTQNLLSYGSL